MEAYHAVDAAAAAAIGEEGSRSTGRGAGGVGTDEHDHSVNSGPLPNVTSAAHEAAKRGSDVEEEHAFGV